MSVWFRKMHGLGNDFVIIDGRTHPLCLTPDQIRRLADRHTGIGFDQLIVLEHGVEDVDVVMHIFNSDASESEMCGNAARCVAHLVMQEKQCDKVIIATKGTQLAAWQYDAEQITVDMGVPKFGWEDIPLATPLDMDDLPLRFDRLWSPTAIMIGNPHVVFFSTHDLKDLPLQQIGAAVEYHPLFPKRVNVSFAQIVSRDCIRLCVWERGAGLTRACGSGACATVVAATRRRLTQRHVTVILEGGCLDIEWHLNDHVLMTGPSATSFSGTIESPLVYG